MTGAVPPYTTGPERAVGQQRIDDIVPELPAEDRADRHFGSAGCR